MLRQCPPPFGTRPLRAGSPRLPAPADAHRPPAPPPLISLPYRTVLPLRTASLPRRWPRRCRRPPPGAASCCATATCASASTSPTSLAPPASGRSRWQTQRPEAPRCTRTSCPGRRPWRRRMAAVGLGPPAAVGGRPGAWPKSRRQRSRRQRGRASGEASLRRKASLAVAAAMRPAPPLWSSLPRRQ